MHIALIFMRASTLTDFRQFFLKDVLARSITGMMIQLINYWFDNTEGFQVSISFFTQPCKSSNLVTSDMIQCFQEFQI